MICEYCEGTGRIEVTCRSCDGTGWVRGDVGGRICCGGYDTEDCKDCKGTGEVEDE